MISEKYGNAKVKLNMNMLQITDRCKIIDALGQKISGCTRDTFVEILMLSLIWMIWQNNCRENRFHGSLLLWGKNAKHIDRWSTERFYFTTRWGRSGRNSTMLWCADNMSKGSPCDLYDRWWDCKSTGSLPWDTWWRLYITWGSTSNRWSTMVGEGTGKVLYF